MPGKVKVKIVAGRNLPVMDRSSDTTDAFVEVKFGEVTYKTDVFRKSLNPAWNSEWFRFEADDLELQDEPLQVRIMDYDAYSANDAIGKVYIDLNPLLLPNVSASRSSGGGAGNDGKLTVTTSTTSGAGGGGMLSGWVPIFDTMHGIRGEINFIVKVELFSDLNRFRQSSCGVHFFATPEVPEGYKIQFLPGFVEELVVNDDPEYKWIDKIRTPRASNEARQLLFMKLSGEVRRKIGLKALELGANAVIGYRQLFDLEGETGIAVRGIGTAVTLSRVQLDEALTLQMSPGNLSQNPNSPRGSRENSAGKETRSSVDGKSEGCDYPQPVFNVHSSTSWTSAAAATTTPNNKLQYSRTAAADISDLGVSISGESGGSSEKTPVKNNAKSGDSADMTEYPFLTMTKFSAGFLHHLGGMVSAKSVKLLEELDDREDGDTRESWWTEIRQEVRSHARALGCNVIVGYQEKTVIWEDVIILSCAGTGAVYNSLHGGLGDLDNANFGTLAVNRSFNNDNKAMQSECYLCHIPYSEGSVPFPIKLSRCSVCERGKVPDILLTTIEPPNQLEIIGRGGLLQARVLKLKKDLKNENNAREVSDLLPFLEYELHRQIVNKLKMNGMNAIFGLQVELALSDRQIVALATGTAVYLAALPPPVVPKITVSSHLFTDQDEIAKVQKKLTEKIQSNKEYYDIVSIPDKDEFFPEIDEAGNDMELSTGNKDICVLEVDDTEDANIIEGLLDLKPPEGVQVISVKTPIGIDSSQVVEQCQTFTQVAKGKQIYTTRDLSMAAQNLVKSTCFKLRRLRPCLISSLQWGVWLDEEGTIHFCLSGTAIKLSQPKQPQLPIELTTLKKPSDQDLLFNLEGVTQELNISIENGYDGDIGKKGLKPIKIPQYFLSYSREVYGINVTPLPFVPGANIDHHLGHLNFFFIRETMSVRETGGLATFVQGFMSEVLGILRSHTHALGGNAVTSFFMSECMLNYQPHKNQAQCLLNVGGDCVLASYVTQTA